MFKNIWTKIKSLVGFDSHVEVPPTPASEQETLVMAPMRAKAEANEYVEKTKTEPIPKTLGDVIIQETNKCAEPCKSEVCKTDECKADAKKSEKPKKPRRPRPKKVPASPEVVAIYKDPPEPVSQDKLDTRLDGNATKPKRRKKKE